MQLSNFSSFSHTLLIIRPLFPAVTSRNEYHQAIALVIYFRLKLDVILCYRIISGIRCFEIGLFDFSIILLKYVAVIEEHRVHFADVEFVLEIEFLICVSRRICIQVMLVLQRSLAVEK